MAANYIELTLPGAETVLVQAQRITHDGTGTVAPQRQSGTSFGTPQLAGLPPTDPGASPMDVGLAEALSFRGVAQVLGGIAAEVHQALQHVEADTVELEFGLDVAVRGSRVLALLVDGSGTATIRVRLGWEGGDHAAHAERHHGSRPMRAPEFEAPAG